MKRIDFVGMVRKSKEADVITNFFEYRFKRGYPTLVLVIGARGTGKSSTCYRLSEKINERLNPLRKKMDLKEREFGKLVDSHLGLISFVKYAQMGDDCILEEISVLYPSRRSMSDDSVGVSKVLDIIRKKRLIIFANTPMALSSDKNIRASANAMIQTYKIIKSEQVVLSRFWKMQPNYLSGKIYMHKFSRDGVELDMMYTKMPNKERWDEYENKKDNFIDEQYSKLLKKAEMKRDKELKELGFAPIQRKPLTDKQTEVMKLLAKGLTQKEVGDEVGVSMVSINKHKQASEKKGYNVKEFKQMEEIEENTKELVHINQHKHYTSP